MFPPKNPQGMPPAAAAQPQPAAAPPQQAGPAGAPPQGGAGNVDIGFNRGIFTIVMSRIQTLTPPEEKILDAAITPQVLPVFLKILPELKPLIDQMMQQGGQPGPIGQPGQPAPAGGPPQGGTPAAPADAEDDPNQGGDNGSDEEDETDNPLVKNQASSGLIG